MRFIVSIRYEKEVKEWIAANHSPGKRSNWFPWYRMLDGSAAIMTNIEPEDSVAFALTFDHEKMDKT